MNAISTTSPLFQAIHYSGQIYFTSQYFHQQYRANISDDGKYSELKNFNKLIRKIEAYENYIDRGDIVELTWDSAKSAGSNLEPVFKSISYKPLMLINATAQVALTHHLDDEVSKTISVQVNQQSASIASLPELQVAEVAARMLRMSETSKIRMLGKICEQNGIANNFLPEYSSEQLTRSLSDLLKINGSNLSARAANLILIRLGIVEELTRPSSGKKLKQFKSLTQYGLRFGKNETAPDNPRETHPRYFVDRFPELFSLINKEVFTDA